MANRTVDFDFAPQIEREGEWTEAELSRLAGMEWLETNGLGGWASSTVLGANTRRYHGLLVTAEEGAQRRVMLSSLNESLCHNGKNYELWTAFFPGVQLGEGRQYLKRFSLDPHPVFVYEINSLTLRKDILAVEGKNTVIVRYRLSGAEDRGKDSGKNSGKKNRAQLQFNPMLAARDYHSLQHANAAISQSADLQGDTLVIPSYQGVSDLRLIFSTDSPPAYSCANTWWYSFEYSRERERGLDFQEDLFNPGRVEVEIEAGKELFVAITVEREPIASVARAFSSELQRREKEKSQSVLAEQMPHVANAARQFLIRTPQGDDTLIAGYHWFTDWGRDTMIALPGICLATGEFERGRKILERFAAALSQGMLPNRFPDGSEEAEYNTADASLWFFVAVEYLSKKLNSSPGDEREFVEQFLPKLEEILVWHRRGARYGIVQDADGLLCAGEEKWQLTWMDARVGDWVVTPRHGKPVEINALWYNAFRVYAGLLKEVGRSEEAEKFDQEAERIRQSFVAVFWNADLGYLNDCVSSAGIDASLRPNQLLALSLPFPVLSDSLRAKSALAQIKQKLLTPVGLRTLSPEHPQYCRRYEGDQWSRDGAYHQGTVWPWLFGPYITALVRFHGEEGRIEGRRILEKFFGELKAVGAMSIPEIFDADAPHYPRGCLAQAWSVAEVLRVLVEELC